MINIDLSNREYHNREELSASDLKLLFTDPYAFKMGIRKERTKAMDLGSAIHCLILEPAKFDRDFFIVEGNKTEKVRAENEGKTLLNLEEFALATACAESVLNSDIGTFFKNGVAENSFFGEAFGIKCKCRPDYYLKEAGLILDLKTTITGGSDSKTFSKNCLNLQYHMQARLYKEILQAEHFLFVVVEKEAPFRIGVFELGQESMEKAERDIMKAIDNYNNLDKFDQIRKDSEGEVIQRIELPPYAFFN